MAVIKTPEDFAQVAPSVGLRADDFGRRFRSGNAGMVEIIGLRGRDYSEVLAKSEDNGRTYGFPVKVVEGLLVARYGENRNL